VIQTSLFGLPEQERPRAPEIVRSNDWTSRGYQLEASRRFFELIDKEGCTAPLLRMATGTGKTRTAGQGIIQHWLAEHRGPVLVLCHLNTLITQFRNELAKMLQIDIGLEQGDRTWEGERVCVASTASLYREARMRRLGPRPTLVICDEAHHYVSKQNHALLDKFTRAKFCGLTATPTRADKIPLGKRFDSIAVQYPMREAVADGYLVPILLDVAKIPDLDYGSIRRKDFNADSAGALQKTLINTLVRAAIDKVGDRRTVHFWPTVEVSILAADTFNEIRPGSAVHVDGSKMDVEEKVRRIAMFKSGQFQHCCNVGVLTEGYDDPGIRAVCIEAPTDSASVYEQEIGRGTRNLASVDNYTTAPERKEAIATSSKPDLLVVDFVGNSGKHRLVSALDILAGDDVDEETLAIAKESVEKERLTLDAALDEAKKEAERRRKVRAEEIAKAGRLEMEFSRHDPFGFETIPLNGIVPKDLDVPSPETISFLKKFSINTDGISGREANRLRREVFARRSAGLTSHREISMFSKLGIDAKPWYARQSKAVCDWMKQDQSMNQRKYWRAPPAEILATILRKSKDAK